MRRIEVHYKSWLFGSRLVRLMDPVEVVAQIEKKRERWYLIATDVATGILMRIALDEIFETKYPEET